MAKKLVINCDVCDSTSMREEDYADYEQVILNCDTLIVSERSKGILSRLFQTCNMDCAIALQEGEKPVLRTVNGSHTLSGDSVAEPGTVLYVNGALLILPEAAEGLRNYRAVMVNGFLQAPRSLEGRIPGLYINGTSEFYPDGSVLLDSRFLLDSYFPLRAKKDKRYYASHSVVIQDPETDIRRLAEKNVFIETPKLVVPEEIAEACAEVFSEETSFLVAPKGMQIVPKDARLDEALIYAHGRNLFIYGDLEIPGDAEERLREMERLTVTGKVSGTKKCLSVFAQKHFQYGELQVRKGRVISNMSAAKIDAWILEKEEEGVSFANIALLRIDANVAPETILEKVEILNCASVRCTSEQKSAVTMVSQNVADILTGEEDGGSPMADVADGLRGVFGAAKDLLSTKIINADTYVL